MEEQAITQGPNAPTFPVLIAPSVLSADFADMKAGVRLIEAAGGDWVHLDVMDGHFVPNLTFGPKMVKDLRPLTRLPFDAHLMVQKPEKMIPWFIEAGVDHITFHYEATVHVHRTLQVIRESNLKAGISIVPSTPASALTEILPYLDIILVMTVDPGFGGQELIPECVAKVARLNTMRRNGQHHYRIAVDGGINRETCRTVKHAGADVLVTGSAFFAANSPREEVEILRND